MTTLLITLSLIVIPPMIALIMVRPVVPTRDVPAGELALLGLLMTLIATAVAANVLPGALVLLVVVGNLMATVVNVQDMQIDHKLGR